MKNNTVLVVLTSLLIGLFLGYLLSPNNTRIGVDGDSHKETAFGSGIMQHTMEEMMRATHQYQGEDYEKYFLEAMIVHHDGAIEMAEKLLEETSRPELVSTAHDIINAQSREVSVMKEWLQEWFN